MSDSAWALTGFVVGFLLTMLQTIINSYIDRR